MTEYLESVINGEIEMTHEIFLQAASVTALGVSVVFWLAITTDTESDQGAGEQEPSPNCSFWD